MIKVGGVREYFNLPWDIAIEEGTFSNAGIALEWEDCLGGTGQMLAKLRANELDMAVVLTEGIVSDILKGNPCKITQFFVNTPLTWGIHVPAHSKIQSIEQMEGKKYAISRFKSGSHLMAYVNAHKNGLKINEEDFVQVKNLDGARESMNNLESEVFFWEKHTTQPFVDNGEFRRIADFSAPWPCFAIAVRKELYDTHKEEVDAVMEIVLATAKKLRNSKDLISVISERFHLNQEEVIEIWKTLDWNITGEKHLDAYTRVISSMQAVGILDSELNYDTQSILV
jgi:ABC-type nitrate/sulfonate/bicarbonate transport system substrate-binding protein